MVPQGQNIQLIAADGRFEWIVNQVTPNPWGSGDLPVFKNLGSDRVNRYHDLQAIPWVWNGQNQTPEVIHFTENENGTTVLDVRYNGDGKDAFRVAYNEVFSPWSNPNSQDLNRNSTPFGFKINSLNSGVYSLDIYVNTAEDAPPSKPYLGWDPRELGQPYVYGWIYLAWNAELWDGYPIESDVNWSELQRKIGSGSWATIYSGPNRVWSDGSVTYDPNGTIPVYFRVRVRDTQNLWSVWSDVYNTNMMQIKYAEKYNSGVKSKDVPLSYSLQQNFPNPFNPVTVISYEVTDESIVQLKIYDILGREVAELVNESKLPGTYQVNFNANDLSSGVYIYRIVVSRNERILFTNTKQMTLMK